MKFAVLLLPLALALAACNEQRRDLGQALSGKPPVIAGSLEGNWQVADLNGGGAPAGVSILFDPGDQNTSRVSGSGGCNRFTGRWQQDGSALKLGPMGSTMMACDPAKMEVEQRFLTTLGDVKQVTYTEAGSAILATADGRKITLRRPPNPEESAMASLAGNWQATAITCRTDDAACMLAGAEVTLTIAEGADGAPVALSGRSGCNRFSGSWTKNGDSVQAAGIATTRMACPPPLMAVERHVLGTIQAASRAVLDGADLVLETADGRRLRFRRQPA